MQPGHELETRAIGVLGLGAELCRSEVLDIAERLAFVHALGVGDDAHP
jgi:hypothetical protein